MFGFSEVADLYRSIKINLSFLRWGGRGVRWPLTEHGGLRFPRNIEMTENETLYVIRASPLARFLASRGKEYVLVAEVTSKHIWVNVYSPVRSEDPGPAHHPLYNEWRGKDGTFVFLVTKEGGVVRPRRIRGVYWIDQAPLMSVKRTLSRNAVRFFTEISEEEKYEHGE